MLATVSVEAQCVAAKFSKPSDLAIPVARRALESMGDKESQHVDLVVFYDIELDVSEPVQLEAIHNVLALTAREHMTLRTLVTAYRRTVYRHQLYRI